jgi:hemerythrin superfamily protein
MLTSRSGRSQASGIGIAAFLDCSEEEVSMNALELLQKDHDEVRRLFNLFKSNNDENEHRQIFEKIKRELDTHSHIEETIFYPAVEDQEDEDLCTLVDEAFEEHEDVDMLLEELDRLNRDGAELRPKMMELIERVEHHASEEERQMFPKVRELMNDEALNGLGEELESEKKAYSRAA